MVGLVLGSLGFLGLAAWVLGDARFGEGGVATLQGRREQGQAPRVFRAPRLGAGDLSAVSGPVELVQSVLRDTLQSIVLGQLGPPGDEMLRQRIEESLELRGFGDPAVRSRAAEMISRALPRSARGAAAASVSLSPTQRRAIESVASQLAVRLVSTSENQAAKTANSTESLRAPIPEGFERIAWKTIGGFAHSPGAELPGDVRALGGRHVALVGYMLPVGTTVGADRFLLVESLWGCCFGAVPELNQVVEVVVEGAGGMDYVADPIVVLGTLEVGERYEEGVVVSLYRLLASGVIPIDQS